MILELDNLYHIYNQGNNRQKIFFKLENYHYFLKKISEHILPFADIIAYCLMPNHFHLMVYVKQVEIERPMRSQGFTQSEALTTQRFNDSIGVMLRSYTRAINKQEKMSGSLFRSLTKAECLTKTCGCSPSFYNTSTGTQISIQIPERQYPQVCFEYIHNNPVKAKLVKRPEDWDFSSYKDYYRDRDGKLINRERAKEFVVVKASLKVKP
ncbi:MAG: transposase [Bacteroidales bacterium]|nr:transposase [Bacteroidales bacterium]